MLISMAAWLAFFSGLYFVEAPSRRVGCEPGWTSAADRLNNVSTESLDGGNMSGTIVDVTLHHQTEPNSSTAHTT